jgi:hypothetical protein
VSYANADDLREKAAVLDKLDMDIANIYARRSGGKMTADAALALMQKTTYLSDREAVESGLATETDPELQAVALGEEIGAFSGSGVAASNHNKENEEMNITKDDVIGAIDCTYEQNRDLNHQDELAEFVRDFRKDVVQIKRSDRVKQVEGDFKES